MVKYTNKNENSIITVHDTEETILDIVSNIKNLQDNGYSIDEIRVHGNNEALIIGYSK